MKFRFIIIVCFFVISLIGLVLWQYVQFNDGKLHIIFCDVGQGDAIVIRTPSGKMVVVDGGSNDAVVSCLQSHMPFWEKDIALLTLTHPHLDHMVGFLPLLDTYRVQRFMTEKLANTTDMYAELERKISFKKIPKTIVRAGDTISFADGVTIKIIGPLQTFLDATSPGGTIGENKEFASLIQRLTYKKFSILLTGDSQVGGVSDAINGTPASTQVLQVPHHGSKYGLDPAILDRIQPRLAIISVGKENKFGHPTKEVLQLLAERRIQVLRTDQHGSIELISDGNTIWVKTAYRN